MRVARLQNAVVVTSQCFPQGYLVRFRCHNRYTRVQTVCRCCSPAGSTNRGRNRCCWGFSEMASRSTRRRRSTFFHKLRSCKQKLKLIKNRSETKAWKLSWAPPMEIFSASFARFLNARKSFKVMVLSVFFGQGCYCDRAVQILLSPRLRLFRKHLSAKHPPVAPPHRQPVLPGPQCRSKDSTEQWCYSGQVHGIISGRRRYQLPQPCGHHRRRHVCGKHWVYDGAPRPVHILAFYRPPDDLGLAFYGSSH